MEKSQEIVDALLESMRADLTDFVEQQGQITSSLAYEERVAELSRQFARELITRPEGQVPASRNAKKKS